MYTSIVVAVSPIIILRNQEHWQWRIFKSPLIPFFLLLYVFSIYSIINTSFSCLFVPFVYRSSLPLLFALLCPPAPSHPQILCSPYDDKTDGRSLYPVLAHYFPSPNARQAISMSSFKQSTDGRNNRQFLSLCSFSIQTAENRKEKNVREKQGCCWMRQDICVVYATHFIWYDRQFTHTLTGLTNSL